MEKNAEYVEKYKKISHEQIKSTQNYMKYLFSSNFSFRGFSTLKKEKAEISDIYEDDDGVGKLALQSHSDLALSKLNALKQCHTHTHTQTHACIESIFYTYAMSSCRRIVLEQNSMMRATNNEQNN